MTSRKCFVEWFKEAGRGHIIVSLSWFLLSCYGLLTITKSKLSTEALFYGIGSTELLWICAGLGTVFSFLELHYLLQPQKLDFYYSLPTNKYIIFWSRYIHGIIHFIIPFIIILTICGLYQGMTDAVFGQYSASYTEKSILIFTAIFLIFYHIGILAVAVSGNIITAILGYAGIVFYGRIFSNILATFASNFFCTYYRIPLFEKLAVVLDPISLSKKLAGNDIYDKMEILNYIPSYSCIVAVVIWNLVLLLLFGIAQKKRRVERLGKRFALSSADKIVEIFLTVLAGLWGGSFFADISGLTDNHRALSGIINVFIGIAGVLITHYLMQFVVNKNKKEFARHRWQLILQCGIVVFISEAFVVGAATFDGFLPDKNDDIKIAVSIDGVDMDYNSYTSILQERDRYITEKQLEKYVLDKDGKTAAMDWLASIVQKPDFGSSGHTKEVYTYAVVCYDFQDGNKQYRKYPIDAEDLRSFSSVYETEEYKKIAYPEIEGTGVLDARFIWSDGIKDTTLKIDENGKKNIAEAYNEDVMALTVEQLTQALPLGFIDIVSEKEGESKIVIYPFFERTCRLLDEYGIPVNKTLSDYEVVSIEIKDVGSAHGNGYGYSNRAFYDDPNEIEQWKQKLVPCKLDFQPLFFPMDYFREGKVEVKDSETSSTMIVYCYFCEEGFINHDLFY